MDLLVPILLVALAAGKNKKAKQEDEDSFTTVTPPSVEIPKPGQPALKIDKVRKLLNRVDFSFTDGKQSQEFKHKWKGGEMTSGVVGKYMIEALTLPEPDPKNPGKMTEGPVMVVVKAPGKGIIQAKRVLVNEGKVIDVK